MKTVLPVTNENGYYEIRLESIGGLGANLCGKILGESGALYLGLNASGFSSYGSEKRGSPVKSHIRFCSPDKNIRLNSPVKKPHLLCIFQESLLEKHPVTEGLGQDTKIIINTSLSPKEALKKWNFEKGTLYCVDALQIAMEAHSRVNMVLLGAIAKASGFIPLTVLEKLCRETLGQKYPSAIASNLEGMKKGYDSLSQGLSICKQDTTLQKPSPADMPKTSGPFTETYTWGYDNAPAGGINPIAGSTVSNDLSPSREGYIPLFLPEKCIHCGLCDSTCPDMVFQFHQGIYRGKPGMLNGGLDYYHCKGCLRCVEVCPTGALVKALEKDYPEKPFFTPNKDLLSAPPHYEPSGPNAWVTGDSYLTEKRVDGGIV